MKWKILATISMLIINIFNMEYKPLKKTITKYIIPNLPPKTVPFISLAIQSTASRHSHQLLKPKKELLNRIRITQQHRIKPNSSNRYSLMPNTLPKYIIQQLDHNFRIPKAKALIQYRLNDKLEISTQHLLSPMENTMKDESVNVSELYIRTPYHGVMSPSRGIMDRMCEILQMKKSQKSKQNFSKQLFCQYNLSATNSASQSLGNIGLTHHPYHLSVKTSHAKERKLTNFSNQFELRTNSSNKDCTRRKILINPLSQAHLNKMKAKYKSQTSIQNRSILENKFFEMAELNPW